MEHVYSQMATAHVFLAVSKPPLHEFQSLFGREVTVVVSLCAQDQWNMRGAPEDWSAYFESMEVRFLSFAMQDLCVSASADALTFYNQARHTVDTWLEAATQLVACFEQFAASGRPFHVLFHCVGGINRSSGMLAAWLVIAHGFSAEDAIDRILQALQRGFDSEITNVHTWERFAPPQDVEVYRMRITAVGLMTLQEAGLLVPMDANFRLTGPLHQRLLAATGELLYEVLAVDVAGYCGGPSMWLVLGGELSRLDMNEKSAHGPCICHVLGGELARDSTSKFQDAFLRGFDTEICDTKTWASIAHPKDVQVYKIQMTAVGLMTLQEAGLLESHYENFHLFGPLQQRLLAENGDVLYEGAESLSLLAENGDVLYEVSNEGVSQEELVESGVQVVQIKDKARYLASGADKDVFSLESSDVVLKFNKTQPEKSEQSLFDEHFKGLSRSMTMSQGEDVSCRMVLAERALCTAELAVTLLAENGDVLYEVSNEGVSIP
ncbi:hypothetical protein AK812_SmicGene41035 [Symbiodinium microadriaticum]|uniref:Tyrosine specific protein phosphatases domain-containing protein n=1 Tax=Symbiodinium microadriaticum TaxID=2951 RepID=A0A1Q9C757_SYMMI|nr:hypothetical protein AK812_SmicGene41035 [Symbiodinium microadriaticum]